MDLASLTLCTVDIKYNEEMYGVNCNYCNNDDE